MNDQKPTTAQIRIIHVLKNRLGLDDELYRDMLEGLYEVRSSKDLTPVQAADFIHQLRRCLGQDVGRNKYEHLRGRPARFATPKQLRLIEALWDKVSYLGNPRLRRRALDRFVYRIVGEKQLTDVLKSQVPKLVQALKAMERQPRRERNYIIGSN